MTKLAFSTNAYTNHSMTTAIEHIADHGYSGVELLADQPHAYLPEFTVDERRNVIELLGDVDLTVSNINANTAVGYYTDAPPSAFFEPSLCTATDADREWRIDYTKQAIDLAEATDSPAVCVASGTALPGNPPQKAYENLVSSLREITAYAAAKDIKVGIEFEPELLIESVEDALTLIDDVDHPSLGINLDLGHVAVLGNDPTDAIRRSAGHITGVHLEDIPGGVGGTHYHTIPGEGHLDFRAIFDTFDDIGYDGFVTLELYTYPETPNEAACESIEYLSDL